MQYREYADLKSVIRKNLTTEMNKTKTSAFIIQTLKQQQMEIKSKIEARHAALELAVEERKAANCAYEDNEVIQRAQYFEKYLVGDAELPETEETTDKMLKSYLEEITNTMKETREKTTAFGLTSLS
jgi:hypothetical protein